VEGTIFRAAAVYRVALLQVTPKNAAIRGFNVPSCYGMQLESHPTSHLALVCSSLLGCPVLLPAACVVLFGMANIYLCHAVLEKM
jgi:hypothetical protein